MGERHTAGPYGDQHEKITPADGGGRSPMARASDGLEFRPYVYRGGDQAEPPAVTAARERHQQASARITLRNAGLDAQYAAWAETCADPDPPSEWERRFDEWERWGS